MTEEGLEFFKDRLSDLAKSGLNLSGYFHAQGEDGEKNYLHKMLDDQVYLQEPLSNLEVT